MLANLSTVFTILCTHGCSVGIYLFREIPLFISQKNSDFGGTFIRKNLHKRSASRESPRTYLSSKSDLKFLAPRPVMAAGLVL